MDENHKLEQLLGEMAREPLPVEVDELAEELLCEFRQRIATGEASSTTEYPAPSQSGDGAPDWRGIDPPAVRLVPDVPTERADEVSRETDPIAQPPRRRHVSGRFITMLQSRRAKWSVAGAMAAAIVLAVGLWPRSAGQSAGSAFAAAIRQFREAGTIVCNVSGSASGATVGATTGKLYVSAQQGSRLDMFMGEAPMMIVYSSPQGSQTIVNPPLRTYTVVEPQANAAARASSNSADSFILALTRLQGHATRELGRQVVNGIEVIGYEIAGELLGIGSGDEVRSELWIDAKAYLPVRYVAEMPLAGPDGRYQLVYDHFEWDAPLDPQLFVPQVPAGYTRVDARPPAVDESALIAGLRNYADLTGKYPPKLDASTLVTDFSAALGRRLGEQMARGGKVPDQQTIMQKSVEIGSGIAYYQQLVREGRSPEYHGKEVAPGQAGAVLVRWKLSEGGFRVVYGDLKTETVGE